MFFLLNAPFAGRWEYIAQWGYIGRWGCIARDHPDSFDLLVADGVEAVELVDGPVGIADPELDYLADAQGSGLSCQPHPAMFVAERKNLRAGRGLYFGEAQLWAEGFA